MTNEEIMTELKSNSNWNKARAEFSFAMARIEQDQMQRKPSGPVEIRGMEFEAVKKIVEAYLGK